MAVKIRLKRIGRTHHPVYRLNAVDSRSPRDGRVIEQLGHYDPCNKDPEKQVTLIIDRCVHWLNSGAIPSETASTLMKRSGIEHKGLRLPKPGKPKAPPAAEGEGAAAAG